MYIEYCAIKGKGKAREWLLDTKEGYGIQWAILESVHEIESGKSRPRDP